jgi:tRNA uridine 5-carbamoylmethylation protein Kti12
MNVYILCGLPGSGKSTWSKKNFKKYNAIILSNDYFRTMLTGEYLFFDEHELYIKKCMFDCLSNAIINNFNVIFDEINLTKDNRHELINFIKNINSDCKIICVWLKENVNNLDRRMTDSRGVSKQRWSAIIDEMKNIFENPSIDEGFSEMIVV